MCVVISGVKLAVREPGGNAAHRSFYRRNCGKAEARHVVKNPFFHVRCKDFNLTLCKVIIEGFKEDNSIASFVLQKITLEDAWRTG